MTESEVSNEDKQFKLNWSTMLFQRVDNSLLMLVRVVIGISIYFWACSYTKMIDYVDGQVPLYEAIFYAPQFLFKYAGFEWVQLWPEGGMHWQFLITKIAAFFLVVGLFTRLSAAILCLSIAYILMVERQVYLNHYYLLSCAAGLLVFLPCSRKWSLDLLLGIERPETTCARWQIWMLRFQLGMPYVFGAIAKMNYDWLHGQPGAIMLRDRQELGFVKAFLEVPYAVEIFSYGGLFYDLLVVPLLLYRRTRWLAVAGSIVFHVSNSQLFNIGVFPWFMLATLIVFFPVDTVSNLWRCLQGNYSENQLTYSEANQIGQADQAQLDGKLWTPTGALQRIGFGLAATYVIVQLLLPVRPWILPGEPSWNERGHRFSWRMMLRNKVCLTTYLVITESGDYQYFPSTTVMTPYQSSRAERIPELVRQAAFQFVRNGEQSNLKVTEVYCLCLVSLNGRRPTPMIDPEVNLLEAKRGWFKDDWVLQDFSALRRNAWPHPREEWWTQLVLPDRFKPLQNRKPSELEEYVKKQGEAYHNSKK